MYFIFNFFIGIFNIREYNLIRYSNFTFFISHAELYENSPKGNEYAYPRKMHDPDALHYARDNSQSAERMR